MRTVAENRIRNALMLSCRYPTADAFCTVIGLAPTQLGQMKAYLEDPTRKGARAMGEKIARRTEQALGLKRGWLDDDHDSENLDAQFLPAGGAMNGGSRVASGGKFTAIQSALIDTAGRLIAENLLTDSECLKLLHSWQPLVEKLDAAKAPREAEIS